MTDDQYRELKRLILELAIKVEAQRLDRVQREKLEDIRWQMIHAALYDTDAANEYLDSLEGIDMPADLRRKLFKG